MNSIENGPSSTFAGLDAVELASFSQLVLFETALDQRQRESGAVHRDVRSADRRNGTPPMWSSWPCVRIRPRTCSAILFEVREIGGDDIDAKEFGIREHHAGIDDDNVVAVADGHGVHPELAEPSKRYYL